jgi:hypothetical protein
MTWVQNQLDDDKLFPQKIGTFSFPSLSPCTTRHSIRAQRLRIPDSVLIRRLECVDRVGVPFPRNYTATCRTILRRLFRVYAHIYYEHFDQICALGIEGTHSTQLSPRSLVDIFRKIVLG